VGPHASMAKVDLSQISLSRLEGSDMLYQWNSRVWFSLERVRDQTKSGKIYVANGRGISRCLGRVNDGNRECLVRRNLVQVPYESVADYLTMTCSSPLHVILASDMRSLIIRQVS